ncbi:MAG: flavodoxin family protein [Dehalococcoidia bacterium]|nr:flavodoxin family protein [Dehalococcoidia bacterium]
MKALVIYDSAHGNTERIAKSIGSGITADVKVLHVRDADLAELKSAGLLVFGSPTNGGRPTPAIQDFLQKLPEPAIKGATWLLSIPGSRRGWSGSSATRPDESPTA